MSLEGSLKPQRQSAGTELKRKADLAVQVELPAPIKFHAEFGARLHRAHLSQWHSVHDSTPHWSDSSLKIIAIGRHLPRAFSPLPAHLIYAANLAQ